ncbi:hypothetical protein IKZ80_00995, partial [bacterium]|nr:hypothetical protein [bacterium]
MTNPRLVRRLPLFSSLFLAVLIVAVAFSYSYRDHALFTEYARMTAIREGNTLLTSFHSWVGRGRFRDMSLEDFTNVTLYVCRNSSASIYSFLMPNMQVFNAGMKELPMRYLAELKDKSIPTNGFRAFHFTSKDGRYMLFCTPVFTYYLNSGTRRVPGVNSYSNAAEENSDVQNRRRGDIRYFCRLLTGSSCHFELMN